MKTCSQCYIEKELKDFIKNQRTTTGYGSKCKECANEYYRNRNKEQRINNDKNLLKYLSFKIKNIHKQDMRRFPEHEFDLTIDDLKDIYNRQDGRCIYSNKKLCYKNTADIYKKISFDRIDNNLPHIKTNLQMTSVFMNMFRGNKTDREFRDLINNS